jgi:hypothetical protein
MSKTYRATRYTLTVTLPDAVAAKAQARADEEARTVYVYRVGRHDWQLSTQPGRRTADFFFDPRPISAVAA